ncbi:helix-turn-helix domain-containing protein [Saccharothrix luteola]|uniref:helix-turn-helix domain-containing protein n=1 Tax=Saccharothrix luteola TaxID=2893018 RepID=UPI0035571C9A
MFWQRRRAARRVLDVLTATPTPEMSATSLSRRTGIDPAHVRTILVRLRKQGWVVSRWSHPDERDRRLRGRLLYRASAYGLWVAGGRGKGTLQRLPEHDRHSS